ncbi:MAG: radical SAM protein [Caldisericota bacterium]|nr:radical SAM protein [Caldisericota bacterium]
MIPASPIGQPSIAEMEDLPLYHYRPGTTALLLEATGCSCRCTYCDRPALARSTEWAPYDPLKVESILQATTGRNPPLSAIAWDGGEPALRWDNVLECAEVAHRHDRGVIVVTNGGVSAGLLSQSPSSVDALLVRFRGFSEEAYRRCGAPLLWEQSTSLVEYAAGNDLHVELSLDIVRSDGEAQDDFDAMTTWMAQRLRRSIPLHLRAIAPEHGFKIRQGPVMPFLENLVESARKQHVGFVYLSNCHGHFFNSTMCPNCFTVVVDRTTRPLDLSLVTDGRCGNCGTDLAMNISKEKKWEGPGES